MFRDGHSSVMDGKTGPTVHHLVTELDKVRKESRTVMAPRRSAVIVQVLVLLTVLLGFTALTVDVGRLYNVKAELQNAADAASLAAASAFTDDALHVLTFGESIEYQLVLITEVAQQRALTCAAQNSADQRSVQIAAQDVVVGRFDWDYPDQPLTQVAPLNAVQVTARFTEGSLNGPVLSVFAGIFGSNASNVSATAIAAFNDRMTGYSPEEPTGILPFAIHKDLFEDQRVNGPDEFEYDEQLGVVKNFPDGVPEIKILPYKYKDADTSIGGAGNFGALNIGVSSGSELDAQILSGVTPAQFELETGSSELTFVDDAGNPTTWEVSGNPGMATGNEDAIASHIGKLVGFFLHIGVTGVGNNAVYTIVGMRFGRVMVVDLSGGDKRVVIQPAVYEGSGVQTDPDAPGTDGLIGRLMIVR